jgi:hypothetical protein
VASRDRVSCPAFCRSSAAHVQGGTCVEAIAGRYTSRSVGTCLLQARCARELPVPRSAAQGRITGPWKSLAHGLAKLRIAPPFTIFKKTPAPPAAPAGRGGPRGPPVVVTRAVYYCCRLY